MVYFKVFFILSIVQAFRYLLIPGGAYLTIWKWKRGWAQKNRIQKIEFSAADVRRELFYSAGTTIIFGAVLAVVFNPAMKPYTRLYADVSEYGYAWFFASFALLVLVNDTYFYWMHRLVHRPKLFGLIHRVHHLSTTPSPMAAYSFHPIESFLEIIWIVPMVFIFPMHRNALILFSFASLIMNSIGHLGVEIYPKSWTTHPVMRWLNTSTHHNRHHREFRGNYGLYFLFWDRWMGTEKTG